MSSHHSLLIVDDEPHVLKALSRTLKSGRYDIVTANNAEEALASIRSDPPSVLLTDQRMPGMKGSELLAEVAALYPDVVGILMSGYADFDSVTQALNDGQIYKFLMKPWDDTALKRCLNDLFTQIELSEEGLKMQRALKEEKTELEQHLEKAKQSTAHLSAYNRYEHLFNELPVALVMTDTDGEILDYNAFFGSLTDPRYSLIGRSVDPWLPAELRHQLTMAEPDVPQQIHLSATACRVTGCLLEHGASRHLAFVVVPM